MFVESNEQDRQKLYGHFFAWPWQDGQAHYFLFTETQMNWTLREIGYTGIERVKPDSVYAKANPHWEEVYLKVIAIKP